METSAGGCDGGGASRVDPDGGEWRYVWNGAGRLAAVERPDGEVVRFAYDALGRRVSKEIGGRKRWWVWDRNCLVHELNDGAEGLPEEDEAVEATQALDLSKGTPRGPPQGAGIVTWIFEDGGFAPLARLTEEHAHSVVCDHRDAPLCVLDEQGEPRWQGHLDIFYSS